MHFVISFKVSHVNSLLVHFTFQVVGRWVLPCFRRAFVVASAWAPVHVELQLLPKRSHWDCLSGRTVCCSTLPFGASDSALALVLSCGCCCGECIFPWIELAIAIIRTSVFLQCKRVDTFSRLFLPFWSDLNLNEF